MSRLDEIKARLEAATHTVTVTLDTYGVHYVWHCSAPEGASCRLDCPEGCEMIEIEGHEHELRDSGECLILTWMENDDANDENISSEVTVGTFPFMPVWNGDYYEWSLGTNAPEDIAYLVAEVERQAVLLQMAAGLISTMDQFSGWHTEDVYKWVLNGMPEAQEQA